MKRNLKNSDEKITGNLIVIKNITQRKNAEEALSKLNEVLEQRVKERTEEIQKSEMHFRALIENSNDGIALSDEFSNSMYRSPGAKKIMGDITIENTISLTHPEDAEALKNKHYEVLKNPGVPVSFQGRFLHPSGHYIWLQSERHLALRPAARRFRR